MWIDSDPDAAGGSADPSGVLVGGGGGRLSSAEGTGRGGGLCGSGSRICPLPLAGLIVGGCHDDGLSANALGSMGSTFGADSLA